MKPLPGRRGAKRNVGARENRRPHQQSCGEMYRVMATQSFAFSEFDSVVDQFLRYLDEIESFDQIRQRRLRCDELSAGEPLTVMGCSERRPGFDDDEARRRQRVGFPPQHFCSIGAAVARPRTTAFGIDAYPDIWTKAASLLQSIVSNHALIDGNERLGWLATAVFLEVNGHNVATAENNDVCDLVINVASQQPGLDEIAAALKTLDRPRRTDR